MCFCKKELASAMIVGLAFAFLPSNAFTSSTQPYFSNNKEQMQMRNNIQIPNFNRSFGHVSNRHILTIYAKKEDNEETGNVWSSFKDGVYNFFENKENDLKSTSTTTSNNGKKESPFSRISYEKEMKFQPRPPENSPTEAIMDKSQLTPLQKISQQNSGMSTIEPTTPENKDDTKESSAVQKNTSTSVSIDLNSLNPIEKLQAKMEFEIQEQQRKFNEAKQTVENVAENIKSIPNKVEKSVKQTQQTIEDINKNVSDTIDEIQRTPEKVQQVVDDTKRTIDSTQQKTREVVESVQAIPSQVQQNVQNVQKKTKDVVDTVQSIPSNVKQSIDKTQRKTKEVVDTVQSIPGKVQQSVDDTQQFIKDTRDGVNDFVGKIEEAANKVKSTVENIQSKNDAQKKKGDESGKIPFSIADIDQTLDQEVADALRVANEALEKKQSHAQDKKT